MDSKGFESSLVWDGVGSNGGSVAKVSGIWDRVEFGLGIGVDEDEATGEAVMCWFIRSSLMNTKSAG